MKRITLERVRLSFAISFVVAITILVLSPRANSAAPSTALNNQKGNPLEATDKNLALGMDHFDAHCAECHGASGKGDAPKGKSLFAADLTSDDVQSKSDQDLFEIISKGVPGTAMPAFASTHSPEEIRHVILFLRKLPKLTPDERKRLQAAMPSEARHQHAGHEEEQEHHGEEHAEHQAGAEHAHEHAGQQKAGHDMSSMQGHSGDHDMMSTITGGPFKSMQAEGSGTSLLPASSPMNAWHWMRNGWMLMLHGNVIADFNHQGGPRGVNKAESINWLMFMAEHQAGKGQLMFRGMASAEPFTSTNGGFPELFQTGETYRGKPIVDAQHPHDLVMELAGEYTLPLSEQVSANLYAGLIGEPALGPSAFMHRPSASENPAAPLGHHWQDSTHISNGVLTAGITAWRIRAEASLFHGAEPDERRKVFDGPGKLDSWSGRITLTPAKDWSFQFSRGHLVNPELLEPGNLVRMTASAMHSHNWSDGSWSSSLIWGRNHEQHGNSNSYLLESAVNFADRNYAYTRLELVDKSGLAEENVFGRRGLDQFRIVNGAVEPGPLFDRFDRVGAFTFGGVRDLIADPKLRVGIGADVTFYHLPDNLKPVYGSTPTSFHVLIRLRPGKMNH